MDSIQVVFSLSALSGNNRAKRLGTSILDRQKVVAFRTGSIQVAKTWGFLVSASPERFRPFGVLLFGTSL